MEFKFSDEMQIAVDKFATDDLLTKYEKSLSIESFSESKQNRKIIQGVYHEDGKLIATDGKILIAVKESYKKELEGIKTSTKFKFTDEEKTEFVKWNKAIPEVENGKTKIFTDDDFTQLEKLAIVAQIVHNKYHYYSGCAIKVLTGFFNAEYIFMLCAMAKKYDLHNVFLKQNSHYCPNPIRIFGDNGDIALMGMFVDDDDDFCFDFDNSRKIAEVERCVREICSYEMKESPFNFKFKPKKFRPRKVNVTRVIRPFKCPMENDDCTDCSYNKYYDEWKDEVTCAYQD